MKKELTPNDTIKIGYSVAHKMVTDSVYPTVDDYVQDMHLRLLTWSGAEKYPVSTMWYSARRTKEDNLRWNKLNPNDSIDDMTRNQEPRITPNGLVDKIRIKDFLSSLSDTERPYFEMFLQGYSYKEIGEEYGVTKQAAHTAMNKIIKRYKNENILEN